MKALCSMNREVNIIFHCSSSSPNDPVNWLDLSLDSIRAEWTYA